MINDCDKTPSLPSYTKSCCMKHLLMLNEHAESQLLLQKYSTFLLKTLNHYYKLNQIYFDGFKLDVMKMFLEIISKYSAKYYFNCKRHIIILTYPY
jgi:hypothetical protein